MKSNALFIPSLESGEERLSVKPFSVSRASIPSLSSVTVGNKIHNLGILKDFKKHPLLAKFIPSSGKISLSWIRLKEGETLQPHTHPILSMVLICKGNVQSLGEVENFLSEGDIFLIPSGCVHGFRGEGPSGFWGLSIQFETQGLYEDINNPLVKFMDLETQDIPPQKKDHHPPSFHGLLERNTYFKNIFSSHSLFNFLNKKANNNPTIHDSFFDLFQVWSNAFQKMVFTRSALCAHPVFESITRHHLEEEFGHDRALQNQRKKSEVFWDPILQATVDWFPYKMFSLDEMEKLVLVHLVVEASATLFYTNLPESITKSGAYFEHFKIHSEIDTSHEQMGLEHLKNLDNRFYQRLYTVQSEGWSMLNSLFERMTQLLINLELFS